MPAVPEFGGALPTFGADIGESTGVTQYNNDAAREYREAARSWHGVSSELGQWGDQVAQDEASRAGKVAGTDANYRPDDSETIRGIAFRNAANTTYANTVEANTRQAMSDAYQNYMALPVSQRTPDVLKASFSKIQGDFQDNHLFPEIKGQWQSAFSGLSIAYMKAAIDDHDTNARDAARAALIQNTNSALDTGTRLAATGLPGVDDEIAKQIGAHSKLIDDQVDNGTITATAGAKAKEDFAQSLRATAAKARFDKLPDTQKAAALESFQKAYGAPGGLANPSFGNAAAPLAFRNNNFTNIRDGAFAASQPGYLGAANGFARFATPEDALRAANRNLDSYAAKGLDTVEKIVSTWSPPGENDTPSLIKNMAERLGVAPGQKLDMSDPGVRAKLVRGLIQQETGQTPYSADEVQGALTGNPTKGLAPETYQNVVNYMASQVRGMMSQASQVQKEALGEIGAAQKQITGGYDVPDATWAQLQSRYAASTDPTIAQAFATANAIRANFQAFKGQPPEAIEARIAGWNAELAKGADPKQVEVVKAAQEYLTRYRADLAADPLGRGAKDGMIAGFAALPRDPAALAAAMPARLAAADQVAAAYHVQPKFFTPDERANFKAIAAAGGQPMVDTAKALATSLGPRLGAALAEIGGEAPTLAGLAQVAAWNGAPGFLADAGEAQRLKHDPAAKGALVVPGDNRFEDIARTELGLDGQAFAALPKTSAIAVQSARDAYSVRAFRDGVDPKIIDDARARRALQESVGATFDGSTQYGGVGNYKGGFFSGTQKVFLPPNMKADQLGTALSALRDEDLKGEAVRADGKTPVTMEAIRGGNLVSIGPGRYRVALGDPKGNDPAYVGTKASDGTLAPFVLDLRGLEPALRQRVPQIYKGAPQ